MFSYMRGMAFNSHVEKHIILLRRMALPLNFFYLIPSLFIEVPVPGTESGR